MRYIFILASSLSDANSLAFSMASLKSMNGFLMDPSRYVFVSGLTIYAR